MGRGRTDWDEEDSPSEDDGWEEDYDEDGDTSDEDFVEPRKVGSEGGLDCPTTLLLDWIMFYELTSQ